MSNDAKHDVLFFRQSRHPTTVAIATTSKELAHGKFGSKIFELFAENVSR